MNPDYLAEMERVLGRKLTDEERRLLSLTAKVQPIRFPRLREAQPETDDVKVNKQARACGRKS